MNNILVLNREFLSEPINGPLFDTDLTNTTPYLQSNTIELNKLITTIRVWTITEATTENQILFEDIGGGEARFYNALVDWQTTEGFTAGDSIRIEANSNTIDTTVNSIQGTDIIVDNSGDIATTLGIVSGVFRSDIVIKSLTIPTALRFKYGLIPNSQTTPTFLSPLDNQQLAYSSNAITGSFSFLTFDSTASTNFGSVRAKRNSITDDYIFEFDVEHIFRTLPWYTEATLNNLINGIPPTNFAGANSLKYVCQYNFGTNVNNPNDLKVFTDDVLNGSVGWRNQNFGSLPSNYTVQNVTFEDEMAAPISTIESTITTTVKFQVKKLSGTFALGQRIIVYHSKLPTSTEYSNNPIFSFPVIWLLDSLEQTEGAIEVDSGIIQNLVVDINGGDNTLLDVEFDLVYSAFEKALIKTDSYYELSVEVWDDSLTALSSDRVVETINVDNWSINTDVPDLITEGNLTYYRSNELITDSDGSGNFSSPESSIWTCAGTFKLAKPVDANTHISELKHQIVAYKAATNEWFVIGQYIFPPIVLKSLNIGGVTWQPANISTQRTLAVPAGDQINRVTLVTEIPGAYQSTQLWTTQHGFVVPWREWEPLNDVPPEFYTASQQHSGFNEKSSNYSGKNGYEIFGFMVATVLYDGEIETTYVIKSGQSTILPFDDDGNMPNEWTGEIEIYDTDDNLTDDILQAENVRLRGVFRNDGIGTTFDISDISGELRIEIFGSSANESRLHTKSTKDWNAPTNLLIPLSGETRVKKTQDNGLKEIYLDCLIEKNNLTPGAKYDAHAELMPIIVPIPVDGRITEDGQARFTQDDQQRIIE